jgi:hypothetical protein
MTLYEMLKDIADWDEWTRCEDGSWFIPGSGADSLPSWDVREGSLGNYILTRTDGCSTHTVDVRDPEQIVQYARMMDAADKAFCGTLRARDPLPAEPVTLTAEEIEHALADVERLRRNASNGYISNPSDVLTCLKQVQNILVRVTADRTLLLSRLCEVVVKDLEARAEATRLLREGRCAVDILAEVRDALDVVGGETPYVSLANRCADMRDELARLRGLADSTAAMGLSDGARAALLAVEQEIRAAYKAREIEIIRKADEDVEAEENETCRQRRLVDEWRRRVDEALGALDQAKTERATHTGHVERMYDKGAADLDAKLRPVLAQARGILA